MGAVGADGPSNGVGGSSASVGGTHQQGLYGRGAYCGGRHDGPPTGLSTNGAPNVAPLGSPTSNQPQTPSSKAVAPTDRPTSPPTDTTAFAYSPQRTQTPTANDAIGSGGAPRTPSGVAPWVSTVSPAGAAAPREARPLLETTTAALPRTHTGGYTADVPARHASGAASPVEGRGAGAHSPTLPWAAGYDASSPQPSPWWMGGAAHSPVGASRSADESDGSGVTSVASPAGVSVGRVGAADEPRRGTLGLFVTSRATRTVAPRAVQALERSPSVPRPVRIDRAAAAAAAAALRSGAAGAGGAESPPPRRVVATLRTDTGNEDNDFPPPVQRLATQRTRDDDGDFPPPVQRLVNAPATSLISRMQGVGRRSPPAAVVVDANQGSPTVPTDSLLVAASVAERRSYLLQRAHRTRKEAEQGR